MTTRQAVPALIDALNERELELVAQEAEEIRGEDFALSEADEQELAEREAECVIGDKVVLRDLLATLRGERAAHSER